MIAAEWLTALFGAAVLIGVGAEYVLPVFGMSPLGDWPAAAVAIGVGGELLFGFRGSRLQGEQMRRTNDQAAYAFMLASAAESRSADAQSEVAKAMAGLAEANERAAVLEKEAAEARERTAEIEKFTAWRHVTPEQREVIESEISKFGADNINLLVEYQNFDAEAFMLSRELIRVFARAGATKIRWRPNAFTLDPVFGLHWATSDPNINVGLLRATLPAGAGLLISVDPATHLKGANPAPVPNLYVFVGPKPPVIDAAAELAEMGIVIAPESNSDPKT